MNNQKMTVKEFIKENWFYYLVIGGFTGMVGYVMMQSVMPLKMQQAFPNTDALIIVATIVSIVIHARKDFNKINNQVKSE